VRHKKKFPPMLVILQCYICMYVCACVYVYMCTYIYICGGDFSPQVIGRSILTTGDRSSSRDIARK